MADRDSLSSANFDAQLGVLAIRYLDGSASPQEVDTLTAQLESEPASREWFAAFCVLTTGLDEVFAARHIPDHGAPAPIIPPAESFGVLPPLTFADNTSLGTYSRFTTGWPLAYLIATVIFAIGLAVGAILHVSPPGAYVGPTNTIHSPNPQSPISNPSPIVARVTGMVDCVWAGDKTKNSPLSSLPSPLRVGDRLALRTGLLELTYDTGARVILQGPVTYEVESPSGGYLSVGKLTARLEKGSGVYANPKRQRGTADQSGRNQHSSDLCPLTSDLFAIRTPTALVTDLGTEFGVEVNKEGNTVSHVFRGAVRLQTVSSNGEANGNAQVLHENESARVDKQDKQGGNRIVMLRSDVKLADFVRNIPKQRVKTLDLVDIVAGGDGFSGHRGFGIDPSNGKFCTPDDLSLKGNPIVGDGHYQRVAGMPFVDGVFIPKSAAGPVQIDSAGHMFAGFAPTDNNTCGYVWAIKKDTANDLCELGGVNYTMHGHAMLEMHANKGITFDLQAIRLANADYKLVQFQTVTGNTERVSEKGHPVWADVWVFVDGQVKFRRREITRYNRAMQIVIPINDHDRFLTLVAADGGNGYGQDQIVFGDPRLELLSQRQSESNHPADASH